MEFFEKIRRRWLFLPPLLAPCCLSVPLLFFGTSNILRVRGIQAGPFELIRPLGDFTAPQFLSLWLGAAAPMQILAGVGELAAGFLLLFRPTVVAGAALAAVILLNSAMLDLCFHTGAAAVDSGLLALDLCLLAPDWGNFLHLFVFDRPTVAPAMAWPGSAHWRARLDRILPLVVIGWFAWHDGTTLERIRSDQMHPSALFGVYRVEVFRRNGRPIPFGSADGSRWTLVAIDRPGGKLEARTANGDIVSPDSGSSLARHLPDPSTLVLDGRFRGEPIWVRLKRVDRKSFPFVNPAVWTFPF